MSLLDVTQTNWVIELWQQYIAIGERFSIEHQTYNASECSNRRLLAIREILPCLNSFLAGTTPIENFKTTINSLNGRYPLWGYNAINGDGFFNMQVNRSNNAYCLPELTSVLQRTLPLPSDTQKMSEAIYILASFLIELASSTQNWRSAPRVGSVPYFLSYFWQIQNPHRIPIYYTSMLDVLRANNIWSLLGEIDKDYVNFHHLNHEMLQLLSKHAGRILRLWDVEYVFRVEKQRHIPAYTFTPAIA